MPKMQVYLPDDLHRAVKELGLPASRLLQDAIRAELHRRELRAEGWGYVEGLEVEHGAPGEADLEAARAWVEGLGGRPSHRRRAG